MKRILIGTLILGAAFCFVGCDAFTKKKTTDQPEDKMALQEVKPEAGDKSNAVQPVEEPAPETAAPATGGRTHIVQRGDTLYSLARKYYNGDHTQWRRIYQANQAQIPNQNQLKVGQQLVIP